VDEQGRSAHVSAGEEPHRRPGLRRLVAGYSTGPPSGSTATLYQTLTAYAVVFTDIVFRNT
jgi:hypothetical protein